MLSAAHRCRKIPLAPPLPSPLIPQTRNRPFPLKTPAVFRGVQAHREGASANEVLDYLMRKLGMTVRPNHLGVALQRLRRAGRLENRDQRWYLPPSPRSKRPGKSA
jgi:hypothetical protein